MIETIVSCMSLSNLHRCVSNMQLGHSDSSCTYSPLNNELIGNKCLLAGGPDDACCCGGYQHISGLDGDDVLTKLKWREVISR